jgi:TolB protein
VELKRVPVRGAIIATIASLVSGCGGHNDGGSRPSRNLIVFTRGAIGSGTLYTVNPDESPYTDSLGLNSFEQVEEVYPTRRADEPAWSPDGTKIAFSRLGRETSTFEIWVMNADGSSELRLTHRPERSWLPAGDRSPAWSPDGKRIAFASDRGGDLAIWVVNADGSDLQRLTSTEEDDSSPSWSPGGALIAFSRDQEDGSAEIYVMNADGSNPRRLTRNTVQDESPVWSPSGKKIAFTHDQTEISGPPPHNTEIYVMNADGSEPRRLTTYAKEDSSPTWSPNGRWIAFVRGAGRDVPGGIYVSKADGSSPFWVTDGPRDASPAWRPTH